MNQDQIEKVKNFEGLNCNFTKLSDDSRMDFQKIIKGKMVNQRERILEGNDDVCDIFN